MITPFTSRAVLGPVVPMPTLPEVGLSIVFPPAPGLMVNAPDPVVNVPPVIVSPLLEDNPVESNPLNVEEAVEDLTCKVSTLNPFEKEEVPVTPTNLNPPPSISIPPEKEEVAVEVTANDVVVA